MSLIEYAAFQSSPQIANPNGPSLNGPNSFSIAWTGIPNAFGTKPPNPQFQPADIVPYIEPKTLGASPDQVGSYPIGVIQSNRSPFAVEHLYNPYGTLSSRLGTNLGATR
jgi:hypothetical protein